MLSLTKKYKGTIPHVPFRMIKDAILGEKYELSLVLADKKLATELHRKWKEKDGPANVLSFPLSRNAGEIFIYPKGNPCAFLFVHGCLHLKGLDHGTKMESLEKKWCKKFGIPLS